MTQTPKTQIPNQLPTNPSVFQTVVSDLKQADTETGAYLNFPKSAPAPNPDPNPILQGLLVGIKDNINLTGEPCTCASNFLVNSYKSPYDATVIKKLKRAGAIPFGRLNMDEFAMGSATENSALQPTRNPAAKDRIPGGSSGGSAAAVAAGTAFATLGSDTGGSIRQPASHCGVVGLKPTYGLVSRYGLVAFASSLDQIGPITRTVEDSAKILQAIAGYDPLDTTSVNLEVPDYLSDLDKGVKGIRIGVPNEYFGDGLHPGVRKNVQDRIDFLKSKGAEIISISLPYTKYAVATYYVIAPAEASSNLSRFDGIRYGNRSKDANDIVDVYHASREAGFGPEVKRRIILGTYVLSSGYYDAYYSKAQAMRNRITKDFEKAFEHVDAIITPVAPTPARKLGACTNDPIQDYLADVLTIPANLAGIPAISIPCGTTNFDGADSLPVGLQIMTAKFREATLLKIAKTAEMQ